jgi:hypothetical protein
MILTSARHLHRTPGVLRGVFLRGAQQHESVWVALVCAVLGLAMGASQSSSDDANRDGNGERSPAHDKGGAKSHSSAMRCVASAPTNTVGRNHGARICSRRDCPLDGACAAISRAAAAAHQVPTQGAAAPRRRRHARPRIHRQTSARNWGSGECSSRATPS